MREEITESKSLDNCPCADSMSLDEQVKWFALLNALKFINHTSQSSGIHVDEKDISHNDLVSYINCVSGDMRTCLAEKGGVPFKYSLNMDNEDAKTTEDLTYDFLA